MATFKTDPIPALVLQCKSCRTLVGDSESFVGVAGVHDAVLITLQAANDVEIDRIRHQKSLDGQDSTFFHICCSECGSVLGRMYTVAPPALQAALNRFAFDYSKVTSYALGSASQSAAGSELPGTQQQQQQQQPSSSQQQMEADQQWGQQQQQQQQHAGAAQELMQRLEQLEAELTQVKLMYLLHDAQLQKLAHSPGEGGSPPELAVVEAGDAGS